jgi:hypothetical protein
MAQSGLDSGRIKADSRLNQEIQGRSGLKRLNSGKTKAKWKSKEVSQKLCAKNKTCQIDIVLLFAMNGAR